MSLMMTMLCMGYCLATGARRFWLALVAGVLMFAIGAAGVALLRHLRHAWPVALLAMTAAWAMNATLTMFVIRSHAPWSVGIIVGLITIAAQLIVGVVCVRRWRRDVGAA